MDEAHCEEETTLAINSSEGLAKSCTIKSSHVHLKNIHCELKKHHEHCLKPPSTKKLPQKIRNARKISIFKKLQISLYDALDRHCTARNLENKKAHKLESALELKETNTYHDVKKSERKASFPNSSTLCDNIFEKFSFIKSNLEENEEENEKEADSVPIREIQNAVSLEPTEKCTEHGKTLIKQAERKESFHGTGTHVSKYSNETSDNPSQPSRINMIDRSPGETLQTSKASSACSSVTSCKEARFSKECHRNMGGTPLCELGPHFISSFPGNTLKLDLKDEFPRKKIKQGRMNQHPELSAAEVVIQEQETVGEQDALNQTMSMPSGEDNDSCSFNLEIDEVIYVGSPEDAIYEENMSQKILNGDHSCDVPSSRCQSFLADVTDTMHSEVQKDMVLNGRDVSNAEERGNSEPAKENSSAGEEERPPLHQPHGVQIVFYELFGSAVKLLGTPRENSEMLCLDSLIELEESSDSDVQSSSLLSKSLVRRRSRALRHEPLRNRTLPAVGCSDDSRAKERRTRRPNKRLICSSKLSREESRIKVVESLSEVLQKRLDDSPDLSVQEDTVLRIAKKVEKALFNLSCCVDQHYKNKYRRLFFNLKSPKNQHLFYNVILGVISPKRLVQMSALELAPEELADWRAREQKRALEVLEKEEREAPRQCLAKFTHKGIVEIDRETDEDLAFQEIFGSHLLEDENSPLDAPNHRSPMRTPDCFVDIGQMAADSKGGYKPPTHKRILKQKANVSKCLQSNAMYSDRGERWLQEDRPISPSIPKKHLRVGRESRTSVIWKGLIQMFSLKQFAAEAYPVSGSGCHLFQTLPDLLQSRGCILPEDVWAYLDSIWPANTKEMALIRFHPSLTKDRGPCNMLYSYLNNKQRYGIVNSDEMEMFMVPLAAYQPVPSKLHPLGGPGLDLCHPSLLLGLILPKRPPTRPDPLPKAKRKTVTFKDNIETWNIPPPPQVDGCQMQPLQHLSLSEPLSVAVLPRQDLLISEEPGSEMFHEECSALHPGTARGAAGQPLLDVILPSQCDSSWIGGQLGNLTLETLGALSQQAGDQAWVCTDREPLHIWNPLGLPSESVCPNHCGVNALDPSLLLNMLCPETILPAKASEAPLPHQIPSTAPTASDTNSVMEEAFSVLQHLTELQSHITPNQETQPFAALGFPVMSQETTSVLSPAVAGLELPSVQQSDADIYAQLQLLLSALGGQTQSPSTC